ncbi:MAG: hypothetical protein HUU30_01850 [Burkholderiaceae bacterium]|nr:hypothetical protein [Aquabacterium sp.]NUP84487.1 hypothetical protein [Burkholderiaceae bacterium]
MDRRLWIATAVLCSPMVRFADAADAQRASVGVAVPLSAPAPLAQLHVDRQGRLLAVSRAGDLLEARTNVWKALGAGLDPAAPIASGHGRVVGRSANGGVWVLESGRVQVLDTPRLAPRAGMLVLAFGIIAVAAERAGTHRVVRLDPAGGAWAESARFAEPVLPDARPMQFDPAGAALGPQADDDGHVLVFGAPSDTRYRHGVLGDAVEPAALILLERHGLRVLARIDLPPPHVFEDIAPRPIAWRGARGLLTVRSGPQGAQLCVVALAASQDRFELAAVAEPIGTAHRWLSPSTDGRRLLAVHTPHIGGVLHRHELQDGRLHSQVIGRGISNHAIGQRDLDVSAWVGSSWVVPTQDRRRLQIIDADEQSPATVAPSTEVAAPIARLVPWHRGRRSGVAALLADGSLWWVPVQD